MASGELTIEKLYKKQNDRSVPVDNKTFTVFVNYLLVEQGKREGLTHGNQPASIGKNWVCHYLKRHRTLQVRFVRSHAKTLYAVAHPITVHRCRFVV